MAVEVILPKIDEAIINSVQKTGKLLIVHEAHRTGGFGAEVAALVADKAFDYLDAPIKRLAALDSPVPFGLGLESFVLPTAKDVVEAARSMCR